MLLIYKIKWFWLVSFRLRKLDVFKDILGIYFFGCKWKEVVINYYGSL